MPYCSIIIDSRGPILGAHVGVSGPRLFALQKTGQNVPAPVWANLLIDTGASMTSIDFSVISKLGIQPTGTQPILTPSTGATPHICNTYDIGLIIPGNGTPKIFPALAALEGSYITQGHQGLLGRDVLASCHMTYLGFDNLVALTFL